MKRITSLILALILTLSVIAVATLSAAAEADITVGEVLEFNTASNEEWLIKVGEKMLSKDGLWTYEAYLLNKQKYQPLKYTNSGNIFNLTGTAEASSGDFTFCQFRTRGAEVHPAKKADVVKSFIVPFSGKIHCKTVLKRNQKVTESQTGVGFMIVLEKEQVYPEAGGYVEVKDTEMTFECDLEVSKGQYVRFHVNSIDENNGSDASAMQNFISYTFIDTEDEGTDHEADAIITKTANLASDVTLDHDVGDVEKSDVSDKTQKTEKAGFPWWIIVVIAAVVIVAAVVAVLLLKKKKDAPAAEGKPAQEAEKKDE